MYSFAGAQDRTTTVDGSLAMKKKFLFKRLGGALVLCAFATALVSAHGADEKISVRGRILDPLSKPVAGARILLRNHDSGELVSIVTNGKGDFSAKHAACSGVSLEVIADEKTRLARAQYGHITGRETKQLIIRLHRGFLITGRVVAGDKGVRDVDVVVGPSSSKASTPDDLISGGGLSRTARDGTFRLVLTPGHKTLKVVDSEHGDVQALAERQISVTADGTLPEIVLKSLPTASH